MRWSHTEYIKQYKYKRKRNIRNLILSIILLLLCFYLSMCFRLVKPAFIPIEATKNLFVHVRLFLSNIVGSTYALDANKIINSLPFYGETSQRIFLSFFTLISGMSLGLSGAVFQQIYRNPIASPATIGATAGVNLGNIVLVLMFSYTAIDMIVFRYGICLLLSFLITLFVLGLCKIYGFRTGNYSVIEMLMVGSILSRIITAFASYSMYHLNGSAIMAYQEINLGVYQIFTLKSVFLFLGISLLGIFIIIKMRYRINVVAFDISEMSAAGVSLEKEQLISQLLATAIVATACIQCGDVGIFTLVVPHIVRYAVGSDFRNLSIYSTIFGGIFLLILRMISSMIFLGTQPVPLSFIVSICMLPLFLVMLALQKRGFE